MRCTYAGQYRQFPELPADFSDYDVRALLDHALKAYNDRNTGDPDTSYIPEKARAVFKRSRALRLMKKYDEADTELKMAASLRAQIVGEDGRRSPRTLTDVDFDDLIAFWSR